MKRMTKLFAALLALLLVSPLLATTYYIRTGGADTNTGLTDTDGGAFLTIHKFIVTAASGDNCLVHAGTYTGTAGLLLSKAEAGYQKSLTVTAYGDGFVYVDDTTATALINVAGGGWAGTSVYTFDGINFRGAALATSRRIIDIPSGVYGTFEIIIKNATVGATDGSGQIFRLMDNNASTSKVRFQTCTLNASAYAVEWAGTQTNHADGTTGIVYTMSSASHNIEVGDALAVKNADTTTWQGTVTAVAGTAVTITRSSGTAAALNDVGSLYRLYTAAIAQIGNAGNTNRGFDTLEFTTCAINWAGSYGIVATCSSSAKWLDINGCTWTNGASTVNGGWTKDISGGGVSATYFIDASSSGLDRIRASNCSGTLTCRGFDFGGGYDYIECNNNTITVTAADSPSNSSAAACIVIGSDNAAYTIAPRAITCMGNVLTQAGSSRSHGLLIGRGCAGGVVLNNTLSGGNYCLVVKGQGLQVIGNLCFTSGASRYGFIMRNGVGCTVAYNTFYSDVGDAAQFDFQTGVSGATPIDNIFYGNNFAIGPTSTGACLNETTTGGSGEANDANLDQYIFDNNTLWYASGTGNVAATINNTTCASLAALQTMWAAYGTRCATNDAASTEQPAATQTLITLRGLPLPGHTTAQANMWWNLTAWQNRGGTNRMGVGF